MLLDRCVLKEALAGHQQQQQAPAPWTDIYQHKWDLTSLNGEFITCVYCQRSVNATRMAPHLEKCMGMGGRLASRLAKRNLTAATTATNVSMSNSTSTLMPSSYMQSGTTTSLKKTVSSSTLAPQQLSSEALMGQDSEDALFDDFYASIDYSSEDNQITPDIKSNFLSCFCYFYYLIFRKIFCCSSLFTTKKEIKLQYTFIMEM